MLTGIAAYLLVLLPAATETKVVMVLAVKGEVLVQAGAGTKRPVKVMDLLAEGEKLSVPASGEAVLLVVGDKHRERVKPGSAVTLGAAGCMPAAAVERLAAVTPNSEVDYQNVARLSGSGRAAGAAVRDPQLPKTPPVVTPMFGAAVLSDRPTLTWEAVEGATGYTVRLLPGQLETLTGKERPVWTMPSKGTRLSYPEKEKPLTRGRVYVWIVTAEKDGAAKTAWQSQLFVVTKSQSAELEKLQPLVEGKDPAGWLLAALTYQEHTVYDEALAQFERLAKQTPKEVQFQAALADYYERAGRSKQAAEALERAKALGFVVPKD